MMRKTTPTVALGVSLCGAVILKGFERFCQLEAVNPKQVKIILKGFENCFFLMGSVN